jgi:hypothetical protein
LTGGREVSAERFSEAIVQPVSEQDAPIGFSVYVAIGSVEAKVKLADGPWTRDSLSVEIEPSDVEVTQSLFGALSNWASDVEAPKWQQRWVDFQPVLIVLLALCLAVGFLMVPFLNWSRAGESASRAEGRKLLAEGVSPANERRAIELILAIESRYEPSGSRASLMGVRYWAYLALLTLGLSCTAICPHITIGVWRGKQRLRRWRTWITFLTVTIPVLIGGSLILPWILHWLGVNPPT